MITSQDVECNNIINHHKIKLANGRKALFPYQCVRKDRINILYTEQLIVALGIIHLHRPHLLTGYRI